MPLHLLGKKSWNVYNADNIARVRRDEAVAKAAEEAEEQNMQELDAERRLAILRGEAPPPLPEPDGASTAANVEAAPPAGRCSDRGDGRRKRKRAGEDDTEFELRLASERLEPRSTVRDTLDETRKSTSGAPITDRLGHFDLFGDDRTRARMEKNEDAEREARKKRQEFEDQYTMRLANAAGKDGLSDPWYARSGGAKGPQRPIKDVWGNEDSGRKDRDSKRMVANDPLAMMKQGASQVRQLDKERRRLREEREQELAQLRRDQRRAERHERRRHEVRSRGRSPGGSDKRRRRRRSRDRHHDGGHDREGRWKYGGDIGKGRHRHRSRSRSPGSRQHGGERQR